MEESCLHHAVSMQMRVKALLRGWRLNYVRAGTHTRLPREDQLVARKRHEKERERKASHVAAWLRFHCALVSQDLDEAPFFFLSSNVYSFFSALFLLINPL